MALDPKCMIDFHIFPMSQLSVETVSSATYSSKKVKDGQLRTTLDDLQLFDLVLPRKHVYPAVEVKRVSREQLEQGQAG